MAEIRQKLAQVFKDNVLQLRWSRQRVCSISSPEEDLQNVMNYRKAPGRMQFLKIWIAGRSITHQAQALIFEEINWLLKRGLDNAVDLIEYELSPLLIKEMSGLVHWRSSKCIKYRNRKHTLLEDKS
jgi:hypothetical protein